MPEERVRPPGWLKPMNKLVIGMLRFGLPISRHEASVVLTVAGRNSGRPRSTPVTPIRVDGKRFVVNGYPGADWVCNVGAADEATPTDGGRSERVRMVELTPEKARRVLRGFPAAVPTGVR
jgi:deazaflavin-dependent oxidoreductase (nitroreductase family)